MVYKYLRKFPNLMRKIRSIFYLHINIIILKINQVQFGKNIRIYNRFYLEKNEKAFFSIGNNFKFTSGESFNPLSRNIRGSIYLPMESSKIIIGNNVGISSACIWAKEKITIGDNVNIGADCIIMDTDCHNLDPEIRSSKEMMPNGMSLDCYTAKSSPITIENDVLIGTRCIILKGVTIGERTIIGSGSVVTKSIPSNCIAAGNPCKVIRTIDKKISK